MADAWYAAFGLLALVTVANSVLLVAMMRQVGLLHQRLPPIGPGSIGPEPGASFERLDFAGSPDNEKDETRRPPVRVLAYVTPGCSLCARIPGFLEAYSKTAPPEVRRLVSFVLATDASERDTERYREEAKIRLPILRHAQLQQHYRLTEVGAPYLLALLDGDGDQELLLAGGIVNTLEQLEDLTDIALARRAAHLYPDGDGDGSNLRAASGESTTAVLTRLEVKNEDS